MTALELGADAYCEKKIKISRILSYLYIFLHTIHCIKYIKKADNMWRVRNMKENLCCRLQRSTKLSFSSIYPGFVSAAGAHN